MTQPHINSVYVAFVDCVLDGYSLELEGYVGAGIASVTSAVWRTGFTAFGAGREPP